MATKKRNSVLLLQNRQGILSAYLQNDELQEAANQSIEWSDFPRKGIESLWRDEPLDLKRLKSEASNFRYIRILDSFFSDTLIREDIREPIFYRAIGGVPVQFLLADPRGPFGKARASAIKQSAIHRSLEGLQRLAIVCNDVRVQESKLWNSREIDIRACKNEEHWGRMAELLIEVTEGLPVEIRLYQVSPSGPLYFFSDLLIAGRFWADTTAANLPWEHIIDTPIQNDLYDIMLSEYFSVWNGAKPLAESIYSGPTATNPLVFISCCRADKDIVHELEDLIKKAGIATYVFWNDIQTGGHWPKDVQNALNECGVLVAILTSNALANKDWIAAEIGAAWALGKHIMQANVGNTPRMLSGILDEQWAVDIISKSGKEKLIADIKRHFGR